MRLENNQNAFFELLRAGLWENEARLSQYKAIDYSSILQLAEEQTVIGLITAGLEHVVDVKVPQEELLQFIGSTLQIEQQNKELNKYVAKLIEKLRKEDVYAILVKGQGIAQCYEKPLWRTSGDIDLLLSESNYEKAKHILIPLAIDVENEFTTIKHIGMTMEEGVVVELHGCLPSRLSKSVDRVIYKAQNDIFYSGNVRSWSNGRTSIFLPSPDNDVIFIFTHILRHFYIEGVGLRQICDWCRLLWYYRDELDMRLLESRIKEAGLKSEWMAFAAFSVKYIGMPVEAMPLYSSEKKWSRKADRILSFVLESGNFGHNREPKRSNNYLIGKIQAAWYKMCDFVRHARIFPVDSIKFFVHFLMDGIVVAFT